ncbi:MAG: FliM/FliN family flagellar motor switch protein [Planctomycetales bacterium]|nr:FliM/FliN family flagellar motor switch protein [Planctomycetales bacterium]
MTIQPHDFSRPTPLQPDLKARLVTWLNRANSVLVETLNTLGVQIEIRIADCSTAMPLDALDAWTGKPAAYRATMGSGDATSVLAIPNPLAQVLVGWLLGDVSNEIPIERELSPAEFSVCEHLVETIFTSLGEAWIADAPLLFQVGDREPNLRRSRLFKPQETLVVLRWAVNGPFGEDGWSWLVPYQSLLHLLGPECAPCPTSPDAAARQLMETLVRDMPTQVVVRLGSVQLNAPQFANLQVGDLIVLDQRVTDPLKAFVSGELSYVGWPGRVGNRQAFQIGSEIKRQQHFTAKSAR